jgi:hypothetical protein
MSSKIYLSKKLGILIYNPVLNRLSTTCFENRVSKRPVADNGNAVMRVGDSYETQKDVTLILEKRSMQWHHH